MRTYIDGSAVSEVHHDAIMKNGRFSVDPEDLFLFSSSKPSMMPGNISLRYEGSESARSTYQGCLDSQVLKAVFELRSQLLLLHGLT